MSALVLLLIGAAVGFAAGSLTTYLLFARTPRRIVADLRHAKDAGELGDVLGEL